MTMILDGSAGVTYPNSSTQASSSVVLQVVNATYSTQVSSSSGTFADTGLTATITPKFSTSKILVLISHTENGIATTAANRIAFKLLKNTVDLIQFGTQQGFNITQYNYFCTSFTYLDSPASTSALTYKTQFANQQGALASVAVQLNSMPSTITLMEIAA